MYTDYAKIEGVKSSDKIALAAHYENAGGQDALDWETLDELKITLVSPNKSGAALITDDTTKDVYYIIDGDVLTIYLWGLKGKGNHRFTIVGKYGTNTPSQFIVDMDYIGGVDLRPNTHDFDFFAVLTK